MAEKSGKGLSQKEYERLGRSVEQIIQKDYVDLALNWSRLMKINFLRGIAAGFGGIIGATLVVGLVLWLLSMFDQIPFISNIADTLRKGSGQ